MAKSIYKNSRPTKEEKKSIEYVCFKCSKTKTLDNFYISMSDFHHHIPICKECVIEMFSKIYKKERDYYATIINMCRVLDIFFDKNSATKAIEYAAQKDCSKAEEPKHVIMKYMTQVNSLKVFQGKTFEDSESYTIYKVSNKDINNQDLQPDELAWGTIYNPSELKWLNKKQQELVSDYPVKGAIQEGLIRDLCRIELSLSKDPTEKSANDIKKSILNQLGFNNKNKEETSDYDKTIANAIKMIEEKEPADLFDEIDLYRDSIGWEKYHER